MRIRFVNAAEWQVAHALAKQVPVIQRTCVRSSHTRNACLSTTGIFPPKNLLLKLRIRFHAHLIAPRQH